MFPRGRPGTFRPPRVKSRIVGLVLATLTTLAIVGAMDVSPASADTSPVIYGNSWMGGQGVNACGMNGSYDSTCGGDPAVGTPWQCVELAQRLYDRRGWYTTNSGYFPVNYAYQIYGQASNMGMSTQANGSITSIVPGDMIIHGQGSSSDAGHVVVVDFVGSDGVHVVEQNISNTADKAVYGFSGGTLSRTVKDSAGNVMPILGVVHSPNNPNTNGGTTPHYQSLAGDFNGDGQADIALRDSTTGIWYFRYNLGSLNFGTPAEVSWAAGTNYQPFVGDFNGDGLTDIALRDTTTGIIYIEYNLGNLTFGTPAQVSWAAGSNYQPFAADFNHDGLADLGLRDSNNGSFYVEYNLGSLNFGSSAQITWAAGTNYQPFVGDFNGDGYADIGLRDTNTGTFYIRYNIGTLNFGSPAQVGWAAGTNYQPFAADLNHDGLADIGLRDANNGSFYVRYNLGVPNFGSSAEIPWAAG